MATTTLTCEQAVFTSVRTPMGEGYRIIAASRALRSDEKQAITRNSPSHNGLCVPPAVTGTAKLPSIGAAFYPLPGGRLCVALSFLAGAEHTGRGGQRVYTHNVVFDESEFSRCGYNAFNVLRAMVAADEVVSPQLKPPPVLPELKLSVVDKPEPQQQPQLHRALVSPFRCRVLHRLLEDGRLIVNLEHTWIESAEMLLLGLPGPMRARVSFGAGLRFSVGRCHHLHLMHDATETTKNRIIGQPVEYLDPGKDGCASGAADSAWISFVDRQWERGDAAALTVRTSRPFGDTSPAGRERVARLYNDIDAIPRLEPGTLLAKAGDALRPREDDIEQEIAGEFTARVQTALSTKIRGMTWAEANQHWPAMVNLWRQSDRATTFTQPLIHEVLRVAMRDAPLAAAQAALQVARDCPSGADEPAHNAMLDEVLGRLAAWAQSTEDLDPERLRWLCDQWQMLRPQCPAVTKIRATCTAGILPASD